MPDLQCIDFHGHDLYSLRDDQTGKEYVLPKRFCEIFQISWPGQHAKLTKNQLFRQGVKKILIPSAQ
ncbi:MAG TPA: phage antirepressor N-terminal domain-containing protein, partial [Candidatus Tectomicrobia bacterium]